jgi:hypothetical protein
VSRDVCTNAGISPEGLKRAEGAIRGRDQAMTVYAAADATQLASLRDELAPSAEPEDVTSA